MTSIRKRNTPAHLPSGPFGFSDSEWDFAKEEVKSILIDVAQQKTTISYSDLVAQIALSVEPHDQRLFSLLGEVSGDEHCEGRPLITVLVVHKGGDMKPGTGFFELANGFGIKATDPDELWIAECNRAFEYWAK